MSDPSSFQTLESMSQAVWYNQWTLKLFAKYLKGDILEVGCGIGNFTKSLLKYGKVWAVDINRIYISNIKKEQGDKVRVGFGDIAKGKYFFGKRNFDSIVCLNVLEHIEKDDTALKNLFDLLQNNGTLILLVPAHPFLYGEIDRSIGHFRRYSKKELLNIMESIGFNIIESWRINFLGAIGWFIAGRILNENKVENEKIKIFNLLAPFFLAIENIIEPPIGTSILVVAQKKI
ncbi:class I SAM-dependent methyltransferase [Candidatus Daviesbacteria bacterium]|nr:class I SAM-dependent methyltransferase [Candidatus Daviesbacteria bacterium]